MLALFSTCFFSGLGFAVEPVLPPVAILCFCFCLVACLVLCAVGVRGGVQPQPTIITVVIVGSDFGFSFEWSCDRCG